MSMARQQDLVKHNPFNDFICATCGKRMGLHWVFRPDCLSDARGTNRKPDGRYYCNRDGVGWAKDYYQRTLRRSLEPAGYRT